MSHSLSWILYAVELDKNILKRFRIEAPELKLSQVGSTYFHQKKEPRRRRAGQPMDGTAKALTSEEPANSNSMAQVFKSRRAAIQWPKRRHCLLLIERWTSDAINDTAFIQLEQWVGGPWTTDNEYTLVGHIPHLVTCKRVKRRQPPLGVESQNLRNRIYLKHTGLESYCGYLSMEEGAK